MQRFFMSLLKKQCNHNFEFSILNFELTSYEKNSSFRSW